MSPWIGHGIDAQTGRHPDRGGSKTWKKTKGIALREKSRIRGKGPDNGEEGPAKVQSGGTPPGSRSWGTDAFDGVEEKEVRRKKTTNEKKRLSKRRP